MPSGKKTMQRLLFTVEFVFFTLMNDIGGPAFGEFNSEELLATSITYTGSVTRTYNIAICAIFRDEDRFLREWIEFHLCGGIEHIFLFSDRTSNPQCTSSLLQPYIENGLITLDSSIPVPDPQIPTYNKCLLQYGALAHWIAFIDIDEFLFPSNSSEQVSFNYFS